MPIPFVLLSAALQEAEKQGYLFVTQTMISIAPQTRLSLAPQSQAQPAFLVVFKSENQEPPNLEKIGLSNATNG
jgi:hypothetical protein